MAALLQFFDKNNNQLLPEYYIIMEIINYYNMLSFTNKLPFINLSEINTIFNYISDNAKAINKVTKNNDLTPPQIISFLTTDYNGVYDCSYEFNSPILQTAIYILCKYTFRTIFNYYPNSFNKTNINIMEVIPEVQVNQEVIPKKLNIKRNINTTT